MASEGLLDAGFDLGNTSGSTSNDPRAKRIRFPDGSHVEFTVSDPSTATSEQFKTRHRKWFSETLSFLQRNGMARIRRQATL